eukprot:PhF_6_TR15049/c0_g1_i1/m.23623
MFSLQLLCTSLSTSEPYLSLIMDCVLEIRKEIVILQKVGRAFQCREKLSFVYQVPENERRLTAFMRETEEILSAPLQVSVSRSYKGGGEPRFDAWLQVCEKAAKSMKTSRLLQRVGRGALVRCDLYNMKFANSMMAAAVEMTTLHEVWLGYVARVFMSNLKLKIKLRGNQRIRNAPITFYGMPRDLLPRHSELRSTFVEHSKYIRREQIVQEAQVERVKITREEETERDHLLGEYYKRFEELLIALEAIANDLKSFESKEHDTRVIIVEQESQEAISIHHAMTQGRKAAATLFSRCTEWKLLQRRLHAPVGSKGRKSTASVTANSTVSSPKIPSPRHVSIQRAKFDAMKQRDERHAVDVRTGQYLLQYVLTSSSWRQTVLRDEVTSSSSLMSDAQFLVSQGNYNGALQLLESLSESEDFYLSTAAWLSISVIHSKTSEHEKAMNIIRKVVGSLHLQAQQDVQHHSTSDHAADMTQVRRRQFHRLVAAAYFNFVGIQYLHPKETVFVDEVLPIAISICESVCGPQHETTKSLCKMKGK